MGAINSKGLISVVSRSTAERRLVANPTTVTLTMNPAIISELNRFKKKITLKIVIVYIHFKHMDDILFSPLITMWD